MPHSSSTTPNAQPLTPAVFYILLALATTERHGYGIMKQTEHDSANQVRLGPGTLYGTLKRLLESKLVEEADERADNQLDNQRRRYYRITPAGQAALGAELERMEQAVATARRQHILPHHKLDTGIGHA
jgi:DNA-binding PadR family transcriptional regulator